MRVNWSVEKFLIPAACCGWTIIRHLLFPVCADVCVAYYYNLFLCNLALLSSTIIAPFTFKLHLFGVLKAYATQKFPLKHLTSKFAHSLCVFLPVLLTLVTIVCVF